MGNRAREYVEAVDAAFRGAGRSSVGWNGRFRRELQRHGLVLQPIPPTGAQTWPDCLYPTGGPYQAPTPCGHKLAWPPSLLVWEDGQIDTGRMLDPLDVRALVRMIRGGRSLRMVALVPAPGHEVARMWVYTVKQADKRLERAIAVRGGEIAGYFKRDAPLACIMASIGEAFAALDERRVSRKLEMAETG